MINRQSLMQQDNSTDKNETKGLNKTDKYKKG